MNRVSYSIAVLALGSALAALYVAAMPPEFSKDSQYYLMAGHTWANGELTYAANLIGARILVVLTWYLPQLVLGVSIDTVSITLGVVFFLYCVGVTLWVYRTVAPAYRFWLSLVLIVVGLVWLPWSRPLTEGLLMVSAIFLLLMYDLARRTASPRGRLLWLLALSALCGTATGIRPEFLLLFTAIIGGLTLGAILRGSARRIIGPVAGAMLVFAAAAQIPGLAFGGFTGRAMPPQLTGFALFWKTVLALGEPSFGPHSQRLHQHGEAMLARGGNLLTDQPMRLGFNEAYRAEGARAADALFANAGWETLRNRPGERLSLFADALQTYLIGGSGSLRVDHRSYAARLAATRAALEKIDRMRVELADVRFGGDATFPVASLLEHRLDVASLFAKVGGLPKLHAYPPAWTISLLALIALAFTFRRGAYDSPVVVASLFFLMSVSLFSFSQGYLIRYWAPSALLVFIAAILSFLQSPIGAQREADNA